MRQRLIDDGRREKLARYKKRKKQLTNSKKSGMRNRYSQQRSRNDAMNEWEG